MKKTFQWTLGVLLLFAFCSIYAQQSSLSAGLAPFNKAHSHVQYGTSPLSNIAYANDNQTSNNISIPMPDGTPFTVIGTFASPVFAASMCQGGDGNYYLIDVGPPVALYLFDPTSGTCTLIGSVTGMGADQPDGLAYNTANGIYYIVSAASLYSFDVNTLTATLIGAFSPTITGLMIDLCFDENGTCYAYDVDITPGAANGYIIDINTAALTTLGYVGFTPNYGQGMSYDYDTHTIYLAAYNSDLGEGELRTMDKTTGNSTLVYAWGDQIAPFAIPSVPPCPVETASNPNPPSGTTDISTSGTTLTWTNGSNAVSIDVWFGPTGGVTEVYSGAPITSWPTGGGLSYFTTYHWYVVSHNDTCSRQGDNWTFKTEQNPNLIVADFYPQSASMWTGTTAGSAKTDGGINTEFPNYGWAAYDVSAIPPQSQIDSVRFFGYVNATNWPYWSSTPMGTVNPITDDAASIYAQIGANSAQGVAYIYSDEASTFAPGWHNYLMESSAVPDLQTAVNNSQGWFAQGFIDRDGVNTYFVDFDGWSDANPPYIEVTFSPTPVELTSFRADVNNGTVVLNWQTATETNNQGFEVQRNSGNGYQVLGFVQGNGTSTKTHSYSYMDKSIASGNYTYRLRQVDFDGKSNYSNEVEVNVNLPKVYSLAQNYPNPFNPSTKIDFNLAVDSKVTLKVFDILGQEVTTLLNGSITAGSHNVTFDASHLTSGVYLYKIEAKGIDGSSFTSIKKMILTK